MIEPTPFERRLTVLLGRVADRVDTDVDAMAVTRLAATGALARGTGWTQPLEVPRAWLWTAVALALAAAFSAGLLIGGSGRSGPIVSASPTPGPTVMLASATVIAHYQGFHSGYVYVYGDGLVLSLNDRSGPWVLMERRLTPEGVDLVRSGAVEPTAFLDGSPQLPDSAWADSKVQPYKSPESAICFWSGASFAAPSRALSALPEPARALLRGKERTYTSDGYQRIEAECAEVTSTEARALAEILKVAGVELVPQDDGGFYGSIAVPAQGSTAAYDLVVWNNPLLPHGTWVLWGG